jgi:hypothetical protein
MKAPPKKGTVPWFELSRMRCVDHLRALLSIKLARSNVQAILRDWHSQSPDMNAALHSSCVISYARPFTSALTKNGKITYPTKRLMTATGFDKELHAHILDLRNRTIAHGDYDIFPSTMFVQTIGDERLPLTLGINVRAMLGIESYDLATRYERHLSVCDNSLEEILDCESKELASEAKLHPFEFDQTHNLPESKVRADIGLAFEKLPGPTGPAAGVENPAFSEGLSEYAYITLTHQICLIENGKHTITEDGVEKEIVINTDYDLTTVIEE